MHSTSGRLRDLDAGLRRASVTRDGRDPGLWGPHMVFASVPPVTNPRWRGQFYDVAFELVTNDEAKAVVLRTPETTYFAIGVERMAVLMGEAGFRRVRRIDGCLFQPVLVGSR